MARSSPSALVAPVLTALSRGAKQRRPSRVLAALRHSLPVVGVVLVVVLVAAIAFFVYDSNRRGAATLSNDLISAIDRRVAVQMQSYMSPEMQFLALADAVAGGRDVIEGSPAVLDFALHALPAITAATGFSYADPQGNFLYVLRNAKGGLDSKLIDRRDGGLTVTWTRRDAQGNVIATETDPADKFDPRTRPWYLGAESTRKPYWTDTYLFFTLKKPGITYAIPNFDAAGKLVSVVGVDIELADLCAFLKTLEIGHRGKAIIVDRTGRVVAYPSDNWLPADKPDAKAPMLDELGDPLLTRAYNRLRVEGFGRQVLELDDDRIIVSSEPVRMMTSRDWVVLIVLIVAALLGFLAWRNLRAERRAAAADERQQAVEARARSFVELARTSSPSEGGEIESLEGALEIAANDCAAKRMAVWRLNADRTTLVCEDCFDRTADDHTSGMELHRDQVPDLFAALGGGKPIDAFDAANERATEDLFLAYLKPLHISSVYIMPIMGNGRLMGMLTVEDPQRGEHQAAMVASCDGLAVVLALRYAAAAPPVPVAQRAAVAAAGASSGGGIESFSERQARLEQTLMQHNCSLDDLGESAIDRAAIGVLVLPDWTAVAQPPPDSAERTAMDAIVQDLRRAIEKSGVSYAALLDNELVLAAFSHDKKAIVGGAHCVATAMLDLRDRLFKLEERWNTSLDFRIAIDVGTVMSSIVGTDPPSRNLWGGAIGVAKLLAGTTARRTIAASETAYALLGDRFLFRPRGSYFLPETGDMRTFVMVGRI